MAGFLKSFRIRFLYFLSLYSTAACLGCLGLLLHPTATQDLLSSQTDQYLRLVILALHVFCVQFGVQTLTGQLKDTLLPTHSKAVLKGAHGTFQSLLLLLFVTLMKELPDFCWSFWSMTVVLLLASPALYLWIPELRSLGRAAGELYFLPEQTVFYVIIPSPGNSMMKDNESIVVVSPEVTEKINSSISNDHVKRRITERQASQNPTAILKEVTFDEVLHQEELMKENQILVKYVENILSSWLGSFLARNQNSSRILVARGPATLVPRGKAGVFLFSDVLIVATKLKTNLKYVNEQVFMINPRTPFTMTRNDETITFEDSSRRCAVKFEPTCNAVMWEKYVEFCKQRMTSTGIQELS